MISMSRGIFTRILPEDCISIVSISETRIGFVTNFFSVSVDIGIVENWRMEDLS